MEMWIHEGGNAALWRAAAHAVLQDSLTLEPCFLFDKGKAFLKLKAGDEKRYTLKQLGDFLNAFAEGEPYLIHENCKYNPSLVRFSQEAEAFLRLLCGFLENGRKGDLRVLPLSPNQVCALLDSLGAMPFMVIRPDKRISQKEIPEEKLPLLMDIEDDLRGIKLHIRLQGDCYPLAGPFVLLNDRVVRLDKLDCLLLPGLVGDDAKLDYFFPRDEMPRFFAELLPVLQRGYAVVFSEGLSQRLIREPIEIKTYLDYENSEVRLKPLFIYGQAEINPFGASQDLPLYLTRDSIKEGQLMDLLAGYGFHVRPGQAFLSTDEGILSFLTEGIAELNKLCEVYLSADFKRLTPKTPRLTGRLNFDPGTGLHFVIQDVEEPEEDLWPLIEALRAGKRYYRYRSGSLIDLSTLKSWEELASNWLEEPKAHQGLGVYYGQYLNSLIQKSALPVEVDESARMAVTLDGEYKSPIKKLYGYQERGFRWICALHDLGLGGILADEMGLGKTVQMIAAIAYMTKREKNRMMNLIVTPTSLMYNWLAEFRRFAPQMRCIVVHGGSGVRENIWESLSNGEEQADVLITSYPLLRQDADKILSFQFRFAVLDEAQNIKNFMSRVSKTAKQLKAECRLAMTGTPLENNTSELWSLFDYVLPGYLGTARAFLRRYGDGKDAENLRLRIRPYLMRREKSEVLSQLPHKNETILFAHMPVEQRRVYSAILIQRQKKLQALLKEKGLANSRFELLSAITQLRQVCCHPGLCLDSFQGESGKLSLLLDILPEALQNGRRVLIFSQFTSMLRIIERKFKEEKIPCLYLDGEVSAQERATLCERFNALNEPVFLISLKAGGTGLNLTAADLVIHYDPWWNPNAEEQANSRAHRIGQKKTVDVIRLITLKSIEENILEMGRSKRRLFERLITPGEALPAGIDEEGILRLLSDPEPPDRQIINQD